jgi:ribonuclease Z
MKVLFLGTGFPDDLTRAHSAEVIQIDGGNLLFDCGRFVTYRLAESNVMPWNINWLFITHHWHADHIIDFPEFIYARIERLAKKKLLIYGPRGITEFVKDIRNVYLKHIEHFQNVWNFVEVKEIAEGGEVCQTDKWKVSSALTTHGLGYRVDAEGKSIVLSGDISVIKREGGRYIQDIEEAWDLNSGLLELAKDADMFIMDADHTTLESIGKAGQKCRIKTIVLQHHQKPKPNARPPEPEKGRTGGFKSYQKAIERVQKHFQGDVIVAEDLKLIKL